MSELKLRDYLELVFGFGKEYIEQAGRRKYILGFEVLYLSLPISV